MSEVNPCTFKMVCRNCNKAKLAERPEVCKAIECEDYNPCPGCGLNRNLLKSVNRGNLCKLCITPSKANEVKSVSEGTQKLQESISTGNLGETELARMRGLRSITVPGTPPESLTETEKAYYMQRWSEYEGYYRNPAAYYRVHQLILLEIHSDYINEKLTSARGEMQ